MAPSVQFSMTTMAPWILYKLLVQGSMHRQMHVANSFDVASAMALIRAGEAARHTEACGIELDRAVRLFDIRLAELARIRRRRLFDIQQMRAWAA